MSEDSIVSVPRQSWLSRLQSAVAGIIFGLLLFVVAFPVLFWNEGRAVATAQSLTEGLHATATISDTVVDPAHEGRPVFLCGLAKGKQTLSDDLMGVEVPEALHLERVVEMYQWKETTSSKTEKEYGGSSTTTKTTSYDTVWSRTLISSNRFLKSEGHKNPSTIPLQSQDFLAEQATIGAFTLTKDQISGIPVTDVINPPDITDLKVKEPLRSLAKIYGDTLYFGMNPESPVVGDLRVRFRAGKSTEVSLIAAQNNNSFSPYMTSNGQIISLIKAGRLTAGELFSNEQSVNQSQTWMIRFAGFLMMYFGLTMIFKPLSILGDVIPLIGSLVEGGTGLISLMISGLLSFLTIALAWIFYRPMIGLTLVALAGILVYAIIQLRRNRLTISGSANTRA